MPRGPRLIALLDALHRRRAPVAGATLAAELGVSLRTLYRDIAALRDEGAEIEGEAGVGYVLRPGYLLPPLSFQDEEIEAISLGLRWVIQRGDARLAAAATAALGRIGAVLSPERRAELAEPALLIGPSAARVDNVPLAALRGAIRAEQKIHLVYRDADDTETRRVVWPVALGFMDRTCVLVAWCELRAGFRHFRADRIVELTPSPTPIPRRRRQLVREWRSTELRRPERPPG